MTKTTSFNAGWHFSVGECEAKGQIAGNAIQVVLPHNAVDLPLSYCDETSYQRKFTYQKIFSVEHSTETPEIWLHFEAAMANAHVYLNGALLLQHADGYTPFRVRITDHVKAEENILTVVIDGSENPEIPPFGGQIDYLTYAGIYRDVWLERTTAVSIGNAKVSTYDVLSEAPSAQVDLWVSNPQEHSIDGSVHAALFSPEGDCIAESQQVLTGESLTLTFSELANIQLWDLDNPALYTVKLTLEAHGQTDERLISFGFRTAEFSADGFRLNGELVKLMGLNRHQSFPYSGYAQGRRSQEKDAELLKYELGCNLVRTSHYPQSTWFLDHCDRIGLLVLEEIPGWQHIGGQAWKQEACRNVKRMIERDWNHPSIICWGVRINESPDDHDFYTKTNEIAHQLDTTRQTCGIRKHTESELLEDIYTMNEFVLGTPESLENRSVPLAVRDQPEVTGLEKKVPYLITEFNGHMFPTKATDSEERQHNHVLRHLDVLDQTFGNPEIAGCVGWCMFDYNTHSDFGSGDRLCHHGVMTIFREPKFAAYTYASQQAPSKRVIMKPVTYWARGERNIGGVLPLLILTNCDEIALTYKDGSTQRFKPARDRFPHLPHPPVLISPEDVDPDLFGKWGLSWSGATFTGFVDGEQVAQMQFVDNALPTTLEVEADDTTLPSDERTETRIMVRMKDQAGNILPYLADSLSVEIEGPGKVIGPSSIPFTAGVAGFWLQASGEAGRIKLHLRTPRFEEHQLEIAVQSELVTA